MRMIFSRNDSFSMLFHRHLRFFARSETDTKSFKVVAKCKNTCMSRVFLVENIATLERAVNTYTKTVSVPFEPSFACFHSYRVMLGDIITYAFVRASRRVELISCADSGN